MYVFHGKEDECKAKLSIKTWKQLCSTCNDICDTVRFLNWIVESWDDVIELIKNPRRKDFYCYWHSIVQLKFPPLRDISMDLFKLLLIMRLILKYILMKEKISLTIKTIISHKLLFSRLNVPLSVRVIIEKLMIAWQ